MGKSKVRLGTVQKYSAQAVHIISEQFLTVSNYSTITGFIH